MLSKGGPTFKKKLSWLFFVFFLFYSSKFKVSAKSKKLFCLKYIYTINRLSDVLIRMRFFFKILQLFRFLSIEFRISVVSTVSSGILYSRFPTVEHILTIKLSLWCHKLLKRKIKEKVPLLLHGLQDQLILCCCQWIYIPLPLPLFVLFRFMFFTNYLLFVT